MPRNGQVIKKLWEEPGPDECWPWLGRIANNGYGKKQYFGKTMLAHRWMYEQQVGSLRDSDVINHLCMNRKCVNPAHLEKTNTAGNARYSRLSTKLLEYEAQEIINAKLYASHGDKNRIAELYKVSPATISDIWYGRSWKELPRPYQ